MMSMLTSVRVWLRDGERGDVPGCLVVAIWAIAGDALITVFNTAIERVLSA